MVLLITGVHGFVGSNLVRFLTPYHTIYGLDIVSPEKEGVVKTFSWDDLDKEGVIPSVDAIIHLAGKAHDTRNKSAEEVYFKVNTELTKRIFDWFLESESAKKFVFFSTAKAAADKVEDVLTEGVKPDPVGPYGVSKIMAESYIKDKCGAYSYVQHEWSSVKGKDVYIFRPCMIHGPGNKGNLNLLYSVVSKGIPWPLGAFDNRRTFTSVENICYAVEGVLTKDVSPGIYNMGDDEALSTNELIEVICSVLGKKARIWHIPKSVMNGIAKVGGWLHLPLNPLRMQKLTENYVSSNAKIKKALGIDRFPVDAREGLRATIACFKDGK